ncbi:LytTR family DNA-binding domain-containing protein [Streptococcus pluranimalium]|uniref:LytTR family DNA-binding domain-containing protein n=1 Tax=Streptococcus pluranimalium TaxID=82348 RepID=UPI003F68CE3F
MVKWEFQQQAVDELSVIIQNGSYDQEVAEFVSYIEAYQANRKDLITIKTSDELLILKIADISAVEVDGDYLLIYEKTRKVRTRQRLYQLKEKLGDRDMIQVSKQSLINISHLERMEASFSGNMTAFLKGGLKVTVSRRYLKTLETRLGI